MTLGVIADVHGNAPALQAVLAALRGRADQVLFLGDLAGYYPFVNQCADLWDGNRIEGVRGNHDQVLLDHLDTGRAPGEDYRARYGSAIERCARILSPQARSLIESWPVQKRLLLASVSIAMCHGAPWGPLQGRVYPDFCDWERFDGCNENVVLLGHTHYPLAKRWKGKWIVNPGSVGQPRDGRGGACYAVLDLGRDQVYLERASYDASAVIADALLHDGALPYLVEVLRS